MTFSTVVPNAGQSPGIFPAQNQTNFTRLKALINSEHVFNDTTQANDGCHRQMTLVNRADPVAVPAGTNSMLYGKTASDAVNELWFYDAVNPVQVNWRTIQGTIVMTAAFQSLTLVPANSYGYVFLYIDTVSCSGTFEANATTCYGYSNVMYFSNGTTSPIIELGNGIAPATLDILVKNMTGNAGYNVQWNYKVFYRLK